MPASRVVGWLGAIALMAAAGHAGAATFVVNSAADTTDGTCGAAVGQCTLREAIEDAVATTGRDTIAFDPTVFPRTVFNEILVTSPLPVIADAAGTAVDGAGARVLILGGGGVSEGLVFTSPPGVPLVKVTVANLVVLGFPAPITICGGAASGACNAEVSGARVQNVAVVAAPHDGIHIEGRTVSKVRITDSAVFHVQGAGIFISGAEALLGARVERCTVRDTSGNGVTLSSAERVVGATVTDTTAILNGQNGIAILGQDVAKAKITNVVTHDHVAVGVRVFASRSNTGTKITNLSTSVTGQGGVEIGGGEANTGAALAGVTTATHGSFGIFLDGPTAGAAITDVGVIASGDNGIFASETTGIKLADVVATGNLNGLFLGASGGVGQRIHAGGNFDTGIALLAGSSGYTIKKSSAAANGAFGVVVAVDATANTIEKNVALGNGAIDLLDVNPACDGNDWTANVFRVGSDPCIH